jgi:predicted secreted protein
VVDLLFYLVLSPVVAMQLAIYGVVAVAAVRSKPAKFWRFSLRGLLITTTIAALVLGLSASLLR